MKKYQPFILLALLAISACNKQSSGTAPATYRVDNISDINMPAWDGHEATVQYTLIPLGSVQETVTLSFENLPHGIMQDKSDNTMTGIPGFTAIAHLVAGDSVVPGTYNIKLVCTGSLSGKREFPVRLRLSMDTTLLTATRLPRVWGTGWRLEWHITGMTIAPDIADILLTTDPSNPYKLEVYDVDATGRHDQYKWFLYYDEPTQMLRTRQGAFLVSEPLGTDSLVHSFKLNEYNLDSSYVGYLLFTR